MKRYIPEVLTPLRQKIIDMPGAIADAGGIKILGHYIQSLIFTTDIVLIRNNNADAVMAVYPFTPQPVITHAIASVADKPVLMGIGGGTTKGKRVVNLALHAEFQGALAVVLNAPVDNATLRAVRKTIDIPIVISIISFCDDVAARLESGADILNVSAGNETPEVVQAIREKFPCVPIIATGGPSDSTIRETIIAGANAITYTPPTTAELMHRLMEKYRDNN